MMVESPLISTDEAWSRITNALSPLPRESRSLPDAAGRVLAETVVADRDQPPFDRATMDGIAIASAAAARGQRQFTIAGVQPAGAAAPTLPSDDACFEVMTGAVLPRGCDCVIPVERIDIRDGVAHLDAAAQVTPWRFVHRTATDYPAGATLLEPGTLLRSPELAVLAAVGRPAVQVARWPRATVVSTGDELVAPGEPTAAHQVRRANDYAIAGALRQRGLSGIELLYLRDDPQAMTAALSQALDQSELLILSGGVSRGKFDYLPDVLDQLQVRRVFHRVRQRPGKPMWFGTGPAGQAVFALPGNPVSALVGLTRYVLPALMHAAGAAPVEEWVPLGTDLAFGDDLAHLVPVTVSRAADGRPRAFPHELNTSGDFFGLAGTTGIVEIPDSVRHCTSGEAVRLFRW